MFFKNEEYYIYTNEARQNSIFKFPAEQTNDLPQQRSINQDKKNLSAIISNGRKRRKRRLNYGNVEQQFELSDNDGFF